MADFLNGILMSGVIFLILVIAVYLTLRSKKQDKS